MNAENMPIANKDSLNQEDSSKPINKGDSYSQNGNLGIGQMSGGEISGGKVAGTIEENNKSQSQTINAQQVTVNNNLSNNLEQETIKITKIKTEKIGDREISETVSVEVPISLFTVDLKEFLQDIAGSPIGFKDAKQSSIKFIIKGSEEGLKNIAESFELGELAPLLKQKFNLELENAKLIDSDNYQENNSQRLLAFTIAGNVNQADIDILKAALIDTSDNEEEIENEEKSRLVEEIRTQGAKDRVLSGADLSSASLSNADLSGADLSSASLSNADLSGADLCLANLSGADLSGADLCLANLSGANLSGANLNKATLIGADLRRASLYDCLFGKFKKSKERQKTLFQKLMFVFTGILFIYTPLILTFFAEGVHSMVYEYYSIKAITFLFLGFVIKSSIISIIIITLLFFLAVVLGKEEFQPRTDLREVDMSQATLKEADLRDANLRNAYFSRTNFYQAIVQGAYFGIGRGLTFNEKRELRQCGAVFDDDPSVESRSISLGV